MPPTYTTLSIILSPYHVGIRSQAVGAGPTHLLNAATPEPEPEPEPEPQPQLQTALTQLGINFNVTEVPGPPPTADGDIGRSFAVFRSTARLVTAALDAGSFPLVLSGNCGAAVGVMAGVAGSRGFAADDADVAERVGSGRREVGCVWFDAHDDYNVPDTVLSGYFDSMPVAIMGGECWRGLAATVPGFRPMDLRENFVNCGMRDVNEVERERVVSKGFPVVWGSTERKVDFPGELREVLEKRSPVASMVHLDMDCLDSTVGQVNKFEPAPGGLSEKDLMDCLQMLPEKTETVSLTIASYDPAFDKGDVISKIAINGIVTFVKSLIKVGALKAS